MGGRYLCRQNPERPGPAPRVTFRSLTVSPDRHWHRFTEADCLDALRRAAADLDLELLRGDDYCAWRTTQPGTVPARSCIVRHLGPWADAVRAAGLRSARPTYGAPRR